MSRTFPPITPGTREYDEVVKIAVSRRPRMFADEEGWQISNRWLKLSEFVLAPDGGWLMNEAGDDLVTRRVRIRIPKGNYLTRPR